MQTAADGTFKPYCVGPLMILFLFLFFLSSVIVLQTCQMTEKKFREDTKLQIDVIDQLLIVESPLAGTML